MYRLIYMFRPFMWSSSGRPNTKVVYFKVMVGKMIPSITQLELSNRWIYS